MSEQGSSRLIIPALGGLYESFSRFSYPIIRICAGLFAMPHGAQKLFGMYGGSAQGTAKFFAKIGIEPALPLVYATGAVEFFGGLCLVLGLFTRPAAAAMGVLMAVAIFKVHLSSGYFWNKGGYEYPLFWGLICLAILFKGGGKYSLDAKIGREF